MLQQESLSLEGQLPSCQQGGVGVAVQNETSLSRTEGRKGVPQVNKYEQVLVGGSGARLRGILCA